MAVDRAGFGLDGKTHQLRVEDDGTMLKVVVPLAGLQTGIALRDKHMREKYLEVEKYPDAVLELPWSGVKLPEDGQTVEATAPGKMTLHGKTKDVQVKYRIVRTGNRYQVTGQRAAEPQGLRHRRPELPRDHRAAGHRHQRVLHRGALLSLPRAGPAPRSILPLALLLALVLPAASAHAYPWMIQHGYTNCSTCHVEPSGFGLLTEYGRAQAQIVLPTLWGGKTPDEVEPTPGIVYGADAAAELAERGPLAPRRGAQHHHLPGHERARHPDDRRPARGRDRRAVPRLGQLRLRAHRGHAGRGHQPAAGQPRLPRALARVRFDDKQALRPRADD